MNKENQPEPIPFETVEPIGKRGCNDKKIYADRCY